MNIELDVQVCGCPADPPGLLTATWSLEIAQSLRSRHHPSGPSVCPLVQRSFISAAEVASVADLGFLASQAHVLDLLGGVQT